jgi:holo-[acyl-carrier protein] synthase
MIEAGMIASRTAMDVLAHGLDLVEVARIERLVADHADRFLDRIFTRAELIIAQTRGRRQSEFLAGRFASKEAVLKALGTGLAEGIQWTEIQVLSDARGAPSLSLKGRAQELASGLGIDQWMISISHTDTHAMASVIAGRNRA